MCPSTRSGLHYIPLPARVIADHGFVFRFGQCGCCGRNAIAVDPADSLATAAGHSVN